MSKCIINQILNTKEYLQNSSFLNKSFLINSKNKEEVSRNDIIVQKEPLTNKNNINKTISSKFTMDRNLIPLNLKEKPSNNYYSKFDRNYEMLKEFRKQVCLHRMRCTLHAF